MTFSMGVSAVAAAQTQDRDRARDPAADQDRIEARDQDRLADRDRVMDRDENRVEDRDQDRLPDRDQLQDRDQLRQQLHVQDRDEIRLRDIYGADLMSWRERREYRARIREMGSVAEWARFRAQHQEQMTARARDQGTEVPPPFYGQQLMTDQERLRLRERLENATTEQERERIRNEHRDEMRARARLHQIPLSELE
jgi:hypothetical protein